MEALQPGNIVACGSERDTLYVVHKFEPAGLPRPRKRLSELMVKTAE